MKLIIKLSIIILIFSFLSCSKKEEIIIEIKEFDQEMEMITAYKEGMVSLEKSDYNLAAGKFLEAELLYPQSEWASKSSLMAAYSYYLNDFYAEAVSNLERFITTYPGSENLAYAEYLIAICFYETIVDEKRDTDSLLQAKKSFENVIKKYPKSNFAIDSKFKLELILDILASKEMYIGRHYLKKSKWIPAINRFKIVVSEYDNSIYTEEAIHRLVEIYFKIGLVDESKKYANLLGYNYQSGDWYKATYKLFNKDYKIEKKKKIKKDKKGIIKKFKKLFY
tara:strand:- start:299 stop:1138 length:840 start_codon:yes stop_codon:yes gene_type:complete